MAPDQWNGIPVAFHRSFLSAVSAEDVYASGKANPAMLAGFDLEIWGVPTSRPAYDPHNRNFVYQRFQRGILHYDATKGLTQGILLADYFKDILMGENLPPDLLAQAKSSPFFAQYNPSKPGWVDRPSVLPNSNLVLAFEPTADIVIDPGHGGQEIGASYTFPDGTVLAEKDVNLAVATRTAAILRQAGYRVTLTRTTDSWVDASRRDVTGDGKVDLADDLQARIDRANEANATMFLSIHFNGADDPGMSGTTVYYDAARPFARRSLFFARLLDQETVAALRRVGYPTIDRGVQTDSTAVGQGSYFYLLGPAAARPSKMPGALVEGLFLTNAHDAQELRNPKVLDALAQAYARAIEIYYHPQN
jgi:N-acetylmuramoyl-L-alanine amidase